MLNIKLERLKRELSCKQMADSLKVSIPTYRKWENGGPIPSHKLEQMANIFNKTTDYLLNRNEAS